MHQRGREIMQEYPYVIELPYTWPIYLKLRLELEFYERPSEGKCTFRNQTIMWCITDSDLPLAGWYFFFKDPKAAFYFKLRYA